MRATRIALMCAAVACRERHEPTTTPIAAEAAPQLLSASGHALNHGLARVELGSLHVRLADGRIPCGAEMEGDAEWKASVMFEIPAGPGAKFFAGAPTGVSITSVVDGDAQRGDEAIVTLDPFVLAMHSRIHGTFDGALGNGTFDVDICALDGTQRALPETAPEAPVAGTIDGHPFAVKKALIERAGTRLEDLRLFQDESITCGSLASNKSLGLYFHFLGGAGSRRPLLGSPQPTTAAALHTPSERAYMDGHMPAWIRFDHLAFEVGAKVTGAVVVKTFAADGPTTSIGGRFEAEVCP